MSFAIGTVHLLLAGGALLLIRRIRASSAKGGLWVSFCLVLLLLAAFFSSNLSLFIWERLPLLQHLQFPWRFLSLSALGAALLCGFPFLLLEAGKRGLADGLMAVLIAGLFLLGFPLAKPETFLKVSDADYRPQIIAERDISVTTSREYEPMWVRERPESPACRAAG